MIQSTLLAALEAAFQAAVKAEVESQLTGIRQHFANTVGELATKVAALEAKLVEAQLTRRTTHIDLNAATDALNQQEWFWQKIRSFIDAGIEAGLDDHTGTYDHDDFVLREDMGELIKDTIGDYEDFVTKDELPEFPDPDDLVTKDELAERVAESIEGRSFTIKF